MIMCVLLCYPVSIHMSQLLSTGRPISSCSRFPLLISGSRVSYENYIINVQVLCLFKVHSQILALNVHVFLLNKPLHQVFWYTLTCLTCGHYELFHTERFITANQYFNNAHSNIPVEVKYCQSTRNL